MALWPHVCAKGDLSADYPFCNASLAIDARAADLISRLTLVEKISLMGDSAAAVPRLGVPKYEWWNEGLHGAQEDCVRDGEVVRCATSFPAPSAMAAAFNDSLYRAVGSARHRGSKRTSACDPKVRI